MIIWGLFVLGLFFLQNIAQNQSRPGEANSKTGKNLTSSTTEAENLLKDRFHDENGLTRAENREVITLAAEVVRLVEERGFSVGEVVVPKGHLREFDLVMERGTGNEPESNPEAENNTDSPTDAEEQLTPVATTIKIRCSTSRLASATAADAIHVFDLWLDGDLIANDYIDIRTPRRAFYK
jgi:hypothetical protein